MSLLPLEFWQPFISCRVCGIITNNETGQWEYEVLDSDNFLSVIAFNILHQGINSHLRFTRSEPHVLWNTLQKQSADFCSFSKFLLLAEECFPWCICTFTLEAACLPRCTELTVPCFAGPLSALGRAEFRIFPEAGAAAVPSQRVPQALGVPGAAASPHPVRCDPGPTSHPRCLPGGAQEELRVLSLL